MAPKNKRRRWLRRIAVTLLVLLALPVLLVLSLYTPPGRDALRDVLNRQVAGMYKGQLRIGRIDRLAWNGPIHATGLTLRDPQGRLIVTDGEVELSPVRELVSGLWRGLRNKPGAFMPALRVHLATVRLLPGAGGVPSIVEAFGPHTPPPVATAPPPPGTPFLFRRIDLAVDRVENSVGGFDATATGLHAEGGATTEPIALVIRSAQSQILSAQTGPLAVRATFDWQSHFEYPAPTFQPHDVGSIHATLDVTGDDAHCHLAYEKTGTREHLEATGCHAGTVALDRAAGKSTGISLDLPTATAERAGNGPWRVRADGSVNAQRFDLALSTGGDDLIADLTVHGLDLARVVPTLPPSDFDGTLHVERHATHWRVDTTALRSRVNGQEIPPVIADADLEGRRLFLRDLSSPAVGLHAHGEVDLDHPMDGARADFTLHTTDAGRIPFVPPGTHGAVNVEARAETHGGRIVAHAVASAAGLRAQGAEARTAHATVDLDVVNNAPHVRGDLRAEGVRAGAYGPLAVTVHAEGDPTHAIDGRLHADGIAQPTRSALATASPVRIDAPVHVRIDHGATSVRIPGATVALRGAAGTIDADVSLPRGGGAPVVHAHLATANDGSADIALTGHELHARFHQFSAAWIARAAATPVPLTGTLEGDLTLASNRMTVPRGTLRWTHARLAPFGDFDLALTTERAGNLLALDGTLTLATPAGSTQPATTVHAVAHALPPATVTDVPGWIRGIRDARVDVAQGDLARLDGVLPAGFHTTGRADLRLVATRTEAHAPLDLVLALDAHDARVTRAGAALVVPLRVRGAVCASVPGVDFARADLSSDLAVGREASGAGDGLPTACAAPTDPQHASLVADPWVQVRARVRGPWLAAVSAAVDEATRSLAAGHSVSTLQFSPQTHARLAESLADARVDLGPLTTERWPFTPEARALSALLAPPRQPVEGTVTYTSTGTLASPTMALQAQLRTWDVRGLVGRNDIVATVNARLAPTSPADFVLTRASLTADARVALRATDGPSARDEGTVTAGVDIRGRLLGLLDARTAGTALEHRHIQLDAAGVDLARFTWAQGREIEGALSVHATDSDDPNVLLIANASAQNLRVRGSPAAGAIVAARVQSSGGAWVLQGCAGVDPSGTSPAACSPDDASPTAAHGALRMLATVPLAGRLPALRPEIQRAHIALAADHVRLEPLSALTEAVAETGIGGELTARLDWDGAAPRVARGEVHLVHGVVDMALLGVPARDAVVDLFDDGQHIRIEHLSFRMGSGTLTGDGTAEAHTDGTSLASARLRLVADRLLLAQMGNNYGALTAHADGTAEIRTDGLSAHLQFHDASVQLPQQPLHDVQNLAPDPHVVVVGREDPNARGGGPVSPGYVLELDLASDRPVVVTRNDLFLVAQPRIHMRNDANGLAISGGVRLTLAQSWFEALGKRFYFDRAIVRFDGGVNHQPVLDVAAHYDSTSAGRINVSLAGPVNNPEIHFTSEQYPASDQSEVLAMLVLGRRDADGPGDQASVASQATSAIAGIAAGFGINLITNVVGERSSFVPRLIVEPGSGLGGGRYGLGVTQFNGRLYVEGTYGTQQGYGGALEPAASQTGGTMQEFRGLVEYSLSSRWSVRGQYGTSNRFGLDVFWVPVR